LTDSVEEGEKIVNAALDKFGRIGEIVCVFGMDLIPYNIYEKGRGQSNVTSLRPLML